MDEGDAFVGACEQLTEFQRQGYAQEMEQDFENQRFLEGSSLEALRASILQLADEVRALRAERQQAWFIREEAAKYLRYSAKTIDRWVAEGRLRRYAPDGCSHYRFKRSELDRLME